MFQLLGAFAEFERNLIREHVVVGLNHTKAKGVKLGRPSLEFDRDELMKLRDNGLTIRDIAQRLNLTKSFVHKTLSNHNQISL